jgi:hypothetical protein
VAIDRSGETDEQHVLEGSDGASSRDAGAISCQRGVLANPEHRVGEHQKYKALVDQEHYSKPQMIEKKKSARAASNASLYVEYGRR